MKFRFNTSFCAAFFYLALAPVVRSVEINVVVGGSAGLVFTPSSVTANPGDVVVFSFRQKNHTATQSTFENPCVRAPGGFDSGFIPVAATNLNGPFPAAKFTVQDTNPVWVYCRQSGHCQQGMVFAINPGSQFAAFQNAARGATGTTSTSAVATTATAPTTTAAAPTRTSTVSTDHVITVGGPGRLIFDPSNITAQIGDTVTFRFLQKNHTATQSTFDSPCRSLTSTSTSGQVGFDSGFMAVADSATNFPIYTIQVNNSSPIWAYCRQGSHCTAGMVFSVNAVESGPNNFAAFKAKAMSSGSSTSSAPGSSPSSGASASSTSQHAGIMLAVVAAVVGSLY